MTTDNLDEVVFDYLEGNLLPQEKEAFELLMNESEVIGHEVKLWRNSYFAEPLPSVTELENRLIISPDNNGNSVINRIFLVLLILSLSVLVDQYIHTATLSINDKQPLKSPSYSCLPVVMDIETEEIKEQKYSIVTETKLKAADIKSAVELNVDLTRRLPIKLDKSFVTIEFSAHKVQIKRTEQLPRTNRARTSNIKQLSRKDIRTINAKKRKDHQRKMEMEFLKGNDPYVVPLNNDNF